MVVLRVGCLLFGVAGTAMALAMIRVRSALDAWWQMASIFSGGMLGLFLLGLISRRARSAEAATAVAIGVGVILWMTTSPAWPDRLAAWRSPFHANLIVVVGTLTIFLTGLLLAARRAPDAVHGTAAR
jgi:SSS family solute:Na+ symporter